MLLLLTITLTFFLCNDALRHCCYRNKQFAINANNVNGITINDKYKKSRDLILQKLMMLLLIPLKSYADDNNDLIVTIPLEKKEGLFLLNYTVGENTFRAILDTGSPFVLAPSICSNMWGCEEEKGK